VLEIIETFLPTCIPLVKCRLQLLLLSFHLSIKKETQNFRMGLGDRVRIARPPPGKREWEDKRASVITLVPIAKHPLDYIIRLDGEDKEHTISAGCLKTGTYGKVRFSDV
jgi:hypothetical protein